MPLYVYACHDCEIEVEELRPVERADDPVECPICHGLCVRALPIVAIGRTAAPSAPAPVYGSVPAGYHGLACGCCAPRRR
jgi:putative FmdB family regulatory protein